MEGDIRGEVSVKLYQFYPLVIEKLKSPCSRLMQIGSGIVVYVKKQNAAKYCLSIDSGVRTVEASD